MNDSEDTIGPIGVECDWWSVGVCAYEMFFGRTPFTDDNMVVTYDNIINFKVSIMISVDLKKLGNMSMAYCLTAL